MVALKFHVGLTRRHYAVLLVVVLFVVNGVVELVYYAAPKTQERICGLCHSDVVSVLESGRHGSVVREQGCNACHTDTSPINTLDMLIGNFHTGVVAGSEACLSCHEDAPRKAGLHEMHASASKAVGCVNCHNPHRPTELGDCTRCHSSPGIVDAHQFMHKGASPNCARCHFGPGKPSPYPEIPGHRFDPHERMDCFRCHDVAVIPPDVARLPCTECHR